MKRHLLAAAGEIDGIKIHVRCKVPGPTVAGHAVKIIQARIAASGSVQARHDTVFIVERVHHLPESVVLVGSVIVAPWVMDVTRPTSPSWRPTVDR